jgi:hypothetical protein
MTAEERELLQHFRTLASEQRHSLMDFAAFLAARAESSPAPQPAPAQPVPIARPETESVVKAIKRLTATYPMLDRAKLLHETSSHMQQHLLQGKPAAEVIDDLEVVFQRHYERFKGGGA